MDEQASESPASLIIVLSSLVSPRGTKRLRSDSFIEAQTLRIQMTRTRQTKDQKRTLKRRYIALGRSFFVLSTFTMASRVPFKVSIENRLIEKCAKQANDRRRFG